MDYINTVFAFKLFDGLWFDLLHFSRDKCVASVVGNRV